MTVFFLLFGNHLLVILFPEPFRRSDQDMTVGFYFHIILFAKNRLFLESLSDADDNLPG
jgi:hypothetical protein